MPKSMSVQIPEDAITALKRLIEFGSDQIRRLTLALRDTGPTLDPVSFRALAVSKALEDADLSEVIETILRDVVFPIRRTMYQHGVSANEMIFGMGEAIMRISSSDEQAIGKEDQLRWRECEPAIAELLDSDTMKIEGKAEALLEARSNRVFAINLYSDLRPLFDEDAEQVNANVLTNTLMVRFNGGGRSRTETFSLNPSDLREFKDQVDRALRKNATLAKGGESQKIPVLVVRSLNDEVGDRQ